MSKPDPADLSRRLCEVRARLAHAAEALAVGADEFAGILERSAARGDSERRLALAQLEHQVAEVEQRNAARLSADGPLDELEHLPRWSNLTG